MARDRQVTAAVLVVIVVAATARLYYATWIVTDFWGDAYHHWLISRLTLANGGLYADYKGLETVWLPGYHYVIAAVMAASGRLDLAPAHATNLTLGVLASGLVTWLVAEMGRDWRAGLGAGLTLALLPWHIAYSHINMPEVMAGALLLLILSAAWRCRVGGLAFLACVGALTRHELTLLMLPIGLWLVWRRRWLAAGGLALGTAVGLGLWSAWSWIVTGDPLMWWIRYRALTAWDARFWTEAGVRVAYLDALRKASQQAYPPLALVVIVLLTAILSPAWRRRVPAAGWLLAGLVAFHWIALGLGFAAGNLPTADPRYVLVSLPLLAGAGAVIIAALPVRAVRLAIAATYAGILIFSLYDQLPDFRDRAYVLAPERAVGEYLRTQAATGGSFWVDAPVTIYFSGLDPQRFFSSDELLPAEMRGPGSLDSVATEAIAVHNIRMVLWENVSYTAVPEVWPQMAAGQAFERDRVAFLPVFTFTGWEPAYGARPTVLWEIRLLDG